PVREDTSLHEDLAHDEDPQQQITPSYASSNIQDPHKDKASSTNKPPSNNWLDTVNHDGEVSLPPLQPPQAPLVIEGGETLECFSDSQGTSSVGAPPWLHIEIPRFDVGAMDAQPYFQEKGGAPKVRPSVSNEMADAFARALYQLMGPGNWVRKYEMEGN